MATIDWRHVLRYAFMYLVVLGLAVGGIWLTVKSSEQQLEPAVTFSSISLPGSGAANAAHPTSERRFAVATMIGARETYSAYWELVRWLQTQMDIPGLRLVCRSYADVRADLRRGAVDAALICTGTFVRALEDGSVRLVAVPQFAPPREYRSLVLTRVESPAQSLAELAGASVGFVDTESHTGCLVPVHALIRQQLDPERFFSRVEFLRSHDRALQALADGLVDAAAVDDLIWQDWKDQHPDAARRLRILWQSETYAPPPVVVPLSADVRFADHLAETLLRMHESMEGLRILAKLGIDRFATVNPEDYESAKAVLREIRQAGGPFWP